MAETHLDQAWADAKTEDACFGRVDRARRRESTMRRASMVLVRHINAPDQDGSA